MTRPAHRAAARLDRTDLARLVDELHRRYGGGAAPRSLQLRGLSDDERVALADLLGLARLPPSELRLPLARLQAALGVDADHLRAAVEELRGSVVDRLAVRLAASAERAEVWGWLLEQARSISAITDPQAWTEHLRRLGLRGSVSERQRWLAGVLAVLRALPSDGLTLAELAQDVLSDPHALDAGRSAAAAVLEALAPGAERRDAEATRALWESVGVAPDALSSTVLALGLGQGVAADHPLQPMWQVCLTSSEPTVHTLAQLRRWPVTALPADQALFVVENPSLLAAAARETWGSPVVVCSFGRPTVAVLTLIRQLTAGGATAYQHADFDPSGLMITSWLQERCHTVPWRMTAGHYRDALSRRTEVADRSEAEEELKLPPTPWDPSLGEEMGTARRWVYEEQVRGSLLDTMRSYRRVGPP